MNAMNKATTGQLIAARNAACAITVGILMDQTRALRTAGALRGPGVEQALKVERHAKAVLGSIPTIRSAKGKKNIELVCDVCHSEFRAHYPELDPDAVMSALVAIFATHAAMSELIRVHSLKTQAWRWLDQTSTKLMTLMLGDMPEEEERLWRASLAVTETIGRIAA